MCSQFTEQKNERKFLILGHDIFFFSMHVMQGYNIAEMKKSHMIFYLMSISWLTEVVIVLWFPWVAVLSDIYVRSTTGNSHHNIVTCKKKKK